MSCAKGDKILGQETSTVFIRGAHPLYAIAGVRAKSCGQSRWRTQQSRWRTHPSSSSCPQPYDHRRDSIRQGVRRRTGISGGGWEYQAGGAMAGGYIKRGRDGGRVYQAAGTAAGEWAVGCREPEKKIERKKIIANMAKTAGILSQVNMVYP